LKLAPGNLDQSPPLRRWHFVGFAALFAGIAVYGSWVPFETVELSTTQAWEIVRSTPLLPVGRIDRSDWVTNVLIFVPIGFCALAACWLDRRRTRWSVAAIPLIVVACLLLSCLIEVGQLWIPRRHFSPSDIIAQFIGTLIGVTAWQLGGERLTGWLRSYAEHEDAHPQLRWLLQAYLAGLVFYAVLPLNLTIHPEELYAKFDRGRIIFIPFSETPWHWATAGELLLDVFLFVPVGCLATIGFVSDRGGLRSWGESLFYGGLIVIAIELAQVPVIARFADATDLVTGTLGVAIGASLTRRFLPHAGDETTKTRGWRRWHWLFLTLCYALFLILFFSLPCELIEDRTLIRNRFQNMLRIPGASLMTVSQFMALSIILRKTLLYVPFGLLLAGSVHHPAQSAPVRWLLGVFCIGVACSLALVIECGQVLNLRHTPDTTDVLLSGLGAAVGVLAMNRLLRKSTARPPKSKADVAN